MFRRFRGPERTIEEKLVDAHVLDGSESIALRGLMIQAAEISGVPDRIIGVSDGTHMPDLTQTDDGRATLQRLDDFVKNRTQGTKPQ